MGWEFRSGKLYYYQKERIGNRVKSRYIGPPCDRTSLFSSLDKLSKERRQQEAAERQIARSELAELARTPEDVIEVLAEARRATAEALEAAGYHQHKRQWRKKRGHKDEDESQSA